MNLHKYLHNLALEYGAQSFELVSDNPSAPQRTTSTRSVVFEHHSSSSQASKNGPSTESCSDKERCRGRAKVGAYALMPPDQEADTEIKIQNKWNYPTFHDAGNRSRANVVSGKQDCPGSANMVLCSF